MSRLVVELRAGEGGQDAELFCAELKSVVAAVAHKRGDPVQEARQHNSRTLCLLVDGDRAVYERLAGVHRVQRIPKNGGGRRHTSTATVVVLDERDRSSFHLSDDDLRVDAYRGSGNGGQNRNKNETAVRLVHLPTGMTVTAERERSQWQNLRAAKAELRRRLEAADVDRRSREICGERRRQILTGERPAKQWTHNAQRGEVLFHATGERWRWSDFYSGRVA
jgi:peptide chain release factor 1